MSVDATKRLYLQNDHCFETEAMITAIKDNRFALNQTCFYSGGGGQPSDSGFATLSDGLQTQIEAAFADEELVIWHVCSTPVNPNLVGQTIRVHINSERRLRLARYHTVLHVLNTITLRDYNGWITGVQINEGYSRIDFNLENFSTELCAELEAKVNTVLQEGHPITAYSIPAEEFQTRSDLLRTLDVKPPVIDGRVRVVEISGFDAQACGGTHVDSTLDVGRFKIVRTENKGRKNKRLYIELK